MVLGEDSDLEVDEGDGKEQNTRRGFTIGGDIGFYEWDFETSLTPKDTQQ